MVRSDHEWTLFNNFRIVECDGGGCEMREVFPATSVPDGPVRVLGRLPVRDMHKLAEVVKTELAVAPPETTGPMSNLRTRKAWWLIERGGDRYTRWHETVLPHDVALPVTPCTTKVVYAVALGSNLDWPQRFLLACWLFQERLSLHLFY